MHHLPRETRTHLLLAFAAELERLTSWPWAWGNARLQEAIVWRNVESGEVGALGVFDYPPVLRWSLNTRAEEPLTRDCQRHLGTKNRGPLFPQGPKLELSSHPEEGDAIAKWLAAFVAAAGHPEGPMPVPMAPGSEGDAPYRWTRAASDIEAKRSRA